MKHARALPKVSLFEGAVLVKPKRNKGNIFIEDEHDGEKHTIILWPDASTCCIRPCGRPYTVGGTYGKDGKLRTMELKFNDGEQSERFCALTVSVIRDEKDDARTTPFGRGECKQLDSITVHGSKAPAEERTFSRSDAVSKDTEELGSMGAVLVAMLETHITPYWWQLLQAEKQIRELREKLIE